MRPGASAAVESQRRSRIAEGHLERPRKRAKQRAVPTQKPGQVWGVPELRLRLEQVLKLMWAPLGKQNRRAAGGGRRSVQLQTRLAPRMVLCSVYSKHLQELERCRL